MYKFSAVGSEFDFRQSTQHSMTSAECRALAQWRGVEKMQKGWDENVESTNIKPRVAQVWSLTWRAILVATVGIALISYGYHVLLPHSETAIKLRISVSYGLTACLLLVGLFALENGFLHLLFGARLKLSTRCWRRMSIYAAANLLVLALGNVYVAYTFSTADWVFYKQNIQVPLFWTFTLVAAYFALKGNSLTPR